MSNRNPSNLRRGTQRSKSTAKVAGGGRDGPKHRACEGFRGATVASSEQGPNPYLDGDSRPVGGKDRGGSSARPPVWAMAVATVTGNLYLVAGSVVMGVAAAIASWLPGRDWAGLVARYWARGLLVTGGVRLRLDYAGGDRKAWRASTAGRPLVYMANHRSLYDVAALLAILESPVRFLTKRSLFRVPGFGWGLKAAGFVPVDREDRSRAAETFAVAGKLLASNVSLVVFPEETRSSGPRMKPFRRGGVPAGSQGASAGRSDRHPRHGAHPAQGSAGRAAGHSRGVVRRGDGSGQRGSSGASNVHAGCRAAGR